MIRLPLLMLPLSKLRPKGRNERKILNLFPRPWINLSLTLLVLLLTQKGDQIAVAKTYLDDIYALIEGYKHSLAEKDAGILWLKASPLDFASFFKGGFQTLVRKFLASDEFIKVQGELLSLAASRLVEATPLVSTTGYPFLKKIFDHAAHLLSVVLNLEPVNLARSEVVLAPKTTRVSPSLTRESTVTLVSSSCEFPSNGVPSSIIIDGAAGGLTKVIVQGIVHRVCDDVTQVESSLTQDSGLVPPPSDIVVALSAQ
ncbi:hypothetical protein Tco_0670946 [Tanacetum coccineum]